MFRNYIIRNLYLYPVTGLYYRTVKGHFEQGTITVLGKEIQKQRHTVDEKIKLKGILTLGSMSGEQGCEFRAAR
jgi:hypothetical protein